MLGGSQRLVARVAQTDRARDCRSDELTIDDRRQFDDVDAVREAEERLRSGSTEVDFERAQTALARANTRLEVAAEKK